MRGMGWDGTGWQNCKGRQSKESNRLATAIRLEFAPRLGDGWMIRVPTPRDGRDGILLVGISGVKVTGCDDLRMAKLKGSKQMEGAKRRDLQILESSPGPNSGDLVRAYAP